MIKKKSIADKLKVLDQKLRTFGLNDEAIHTGPIIRQEEIYFGFDIEMRRKIMRTLMSFYRHVDINCMYIHIEKKHLEDEFEITAALSMLNPEYLDDLVLSEQHCTIHRVKDVSTYCDPRVRNRILKNHIELINLHDMLYGTSQYQDHLKEINSELWIGNMK